MKKTLVSAALAATALSMPAFAHENDGRARVDDHAPIGVMADHFHKEGEWMISARGMFMDMNDPANTMMGPQSMDMDMGMLGVMYAPSDKLTLAGMIGYTKNAMDMIMMGNPMQMEGDGITDLKLSAIVPFYKSEKSRFHVTIGTSIPLGETGARNAMGAALPLTMQPGKGSWGLMPSATYSQFENGWSFGFQLGGTFWLDDHGTGEKPGDMWYATGWSSVTLTDDISLSARLAYEDQSSWRGVAPMLGGARDRLRGFVGANFYVADRHRLGVEIGLPLSEDRGTNNLEAGTTILVGWQKAF